MTLIIGIRCQEGIVIGADSMIKAGTDFSNIQLTSEKIRLFRENGIAAFAGDVGLGQIVLDSLEEQEIPPSTAASKNEMKDNLTQAIGNSMLSYHNMVRNFGGQLRIPDVLVALLDQEQPVLVLYSQAIPIAEASEGMSFLTSGSGANLANSFLKFLEKSFWRGESPKTIGKGVFSALWTLNHVIEANASMGVGGDPSIAVLEIDGQTWKARILQSEELELHQESIDEIEESLGEFWAHLN